MKYLLVAFVFVCGSVWAQVPAAAHKYRPHLIRASHAVWGLNAPIPAFAAQIHQESAWRSDVCSPYACGLTQFTPDTAEWIGNLYGVELGPTDRFNPVWAIRAMVRYDKYLFDSTPGHTECDRFWGALRKYNGGPGHWNMESRHATDRLDRYDVDLQCGKARRSIKHCPENVGYPRRILLTHQPKYASWGVRVCN
jgi:soluble lytic murein transglycosylase-like protein